MIGDEAVSHPELVRRVQAEGHEIGNHSFTHPNMAHVGDERVELELTAADRALESITGRQITLFRPPYNADSEPDSYGEIAPIAVASRLGYATAGESIDPNDWDLTGWTRAGRRTSCGRTRSSPRFWPRPTRATPSCCTTPAATGPRPWPPCPPSSTG
jgi:peptidoglycan/xylan/chitin deacetylase (PgdA/CDA1 family)